MPARPPCDQPIEIVAEGGEVIIDGHGIALSLTPEAAEETSNRLYDCTAKARGQRRYGDKGPPA
jgi:hypothetical protein